MDRDAYCQQMRTFWGVPDVQAAKFGRILVSNELRNASPAERDALWNEITAEHVQLVLDGIPWTPCWRALEVGCGIGRMLEPMRARMEEVDGVDISAAMIAYAQQYLHRKNGVLYTTHGDTLGMCVDSFYNFVYSLLVIQHIRSREVVEAYLKEMCRVLAPDGWCRLQVAEASPNHGAWDEEPEAGINYGFQGNGYTEDELWMLMEDVGFDRLTVVHDDSLKHLWVTGQKGE